MERCCLAWHSIAWHIMARHGALYIRCERRRMGRHRSTSRRRPCRSSHEPPLVSIASKGLRLARRKMQEYDMQRQTPAKHRREWRPHSIIRGHRSPNGRGPRRRAPLVGQGCSSHACRCIPGEGPQGADGQDPAFRVFPGGPRQSKKKVYCGEWTGSHASYLSIGAGHRHGLSLSPPSLPTLCSVQGRGVEKSKKVQTFLCEPLSRGDVCALSCSYLTRSLHLRIHHG